MLLRISITALLIAGCLCPKAQFYFYDDKYFDKPWLFEIGGSVAVFNCLTDLGGNKGVGKKFIKDLNLKNSQLGGSAFLSAAYMYSYVLRLEGSFGQVKAYDSILKSVAPSTFGRYERNLSFRSSIFEGMAVVEFHPLFMFRKFDSELPVPRFSPYLLAGVGYFSFNPQAKLGNNWVNLHDLHLEGQGFAEYPERKEYSLSQINFPVGGGLKYELSQFFNVRAEFVYRILKTDYLDDVSKVYYVDPSVFNRYLSGAALANARALYDRRGEISTPTSDIAQRGNPENTDAYFTFNLKLGLMFGRERMTNASGRRK